MNNIQAMISREVLDLLLGTYLQELSVLTAQQELYLTSLVLEDDEVHIEAEIHEGTLQ